MTFTSPGLRTKIILAVVVLVGVVIGLALAVPRLRRLAAAKLRPRIRDVWGNLRQVASSPRKLVLLLGGALGRELLIAMSLSVSLRAFGDHLRLPVLIVVIVLALHEPKSTTAPSARWADHPIEGANCVGTVLVSDA